MASWINTFKRFFAPRKRAPLVANKPPRNRRVQLSFDMLEDRLAPSVSSILSGSTLDVSLSAANDHAYLRVNAGFVQVDSSNQFRPTDAAFAQYPTASVNAIAVSNTGAAANQEVTFTGGTAFSLSSTLTVSGVQTTDVNQAISASSISGDATTVNVAAPGSIQNGIDLATSGATVNVAAGTYVANGSTIVSGSAVGQAGQEIAELNIDKPLSLIGPNPNFTPTSPGSTTAHAQAIIVPGASDPNPNDTTAIIVVLISASNVTIEGLTVNGINTNLTHHSPHVTANSAAAIDASEDIASYANVSDITLKSNIVENAGFLGVDFNNGTDASGGATTGNVITENLIKNISSAFFFGDGISLANNFYAAVTANVLTNVFTGVQISDFSQANPDDPQFASISNNLINAGAAGVFYNLTTEPAATLFAVADNTITAVNNASYTSWQGIFIAVDGTQNPSFTDNTINGSGANAATLTAGYEVWNTPNATIVGGTVSGVADGIWANSFEGNDSPGGATSVSISGIHITARQIGVYVEDSVQDFAGNAPEVPVSATITGGASIKVNGGIGVKVSGPEASATINGSGATIFASKIGVEVIGTSGAGSASATVSNSHIYGDNTGVEFTGGGSGSVSGNNFSGPSANATDLLIAAAAGTVSIGDGNAFAGSVDYIQNLGSQAFDLSGFTATTFGGFNAATTAAIAGRLSPFFGIENKILDYLDNPSYGYVKLKAGDVFVTHMSETINAGAISRGINVALADDTVFVQFGGYTDNLAISQNLSVVGAGSGSTTIRAGGGVGAAVSGSGNTITLQGLTITGGSSAITSSGIATLNLTDVASSGNTNGGSLFGTSGTVNLTGGAGVSVKADASAMTFGDGVLQAISFDGATLNNLNLGTLGHGVAFTVTPVTGGTTAITVDGGTPFPSGNTSTLTLKVSDVSNPTINNTGPGAGNLSTSPPANPVSWMHIRGVTVSQTAPP